MLIVVAMTLSMFLPSCTNDRHYGEKNYKDTTTVLVSSTKNLDKLTEERKKFIPATTNKSYMISSDDYYGRIDAFYISPVDTYVTYKCHCGAFGTIAPPYKIDSGK